MIKIVLLALLVVRFENVRAECKKSITTASGSAAPQNICSGDLIFEDNFDTFDLQKWDHEQTLGGNGNNEFEWYTNNRNNSFAENGILHIKPTFVADEYGDNFLYSGTIDLGNECTNSDNNGCRRTGTSTNIVNPIKSARIRTLKSFSFKYGKVEVSAKVPLGDWLWPAIWMLPTKWKYGPWPISGEVNIVETRGNQQLLVGNNRDIGVSLAGGTLHWGPNFKINIHEKTHYEKHLPEGFNTAFHKYQLEWTDNCIKFFIDDEEIGRAVLPDGGFWEYGDLHTTGLPNPWQQGTKMAPFDEEFNIILNLAIGGNFFPDGAENKFGKKPWSYFAPAQAMTSFWTKRDEWRPTWNLNTDNSHLQVDYVRVWAI